MYAFLYFFIGIASVDKILVILSNDLEQNVYSEYFKEITSLENELTYKTSDSTKIKLGNNGDYFYSTIILMCPSLEDNK